MICSDDSGSSASSGPHPAWKRTLDLACCALALPLLAFVGVGFAGLLMITSRGPLLYRQERVGFRGRRFQIYKFRTMHVATEPSCHQDHFSTLMRTNAPMQKLDSHGDARLIRGARLLRAMGLDELPQVINIVAGEMSIVGPRPCIPYEYEQYTEEQRQRFACVPGLTGLWQVSGKNRTTFSEMIRLDRQYAQRRSLGLDVLIILKTPLALCRQCFDILLHRANNLVGKPLSRAICDQR